MIYVAAVIFLIVTVAVVLAIVKFRAKPNDPIPKKIFGNHKIEILWTVIPLLVVAYLFVMTVVTMFAVDPPPGKKDPDIIVIAHQWWWEIKYPKLGVITANEIHLPVGKKLLLQVNSADVIHSFWVPALARKIDAIPGRDNFIYFEASVPGVYGGYCSEFCGTQHAGMRITAVAQSEDEFHRWVMQQKAIPVAPSHPLAAQGARLFAEKTCYNCHTVAGTGAAQSVGPDLTTVTTRLTLGAGVVENSRENLRKWLEDPAQFKPGSHMANFQLKPNELEALVAYLEFLPGENLSGEVPK
jgi:cytochrome c oxidase subunit 2